MTAFEKVCDALERETGMRPQADGMTRCPAHPDRTPSLSVTAPDGDKVLLNCFAGCEQVAVVDALGLKMSDLFEPLPKKPKKGGLGPIECVYPYTDENGAEVFQVVRFAGKEFRQRHRAPDGRGWISNAGTKRRPLYRLHEVRAAVESGRTIYVVEGEKDADAVCRAGSVATCNPMGGVGKDGKDKWLTEHTESLRGAAKVIVVADNDEAGMKHARRVRHELVTAGVPDVTVVRAKIGKDAADHLGAGLDLDDLVPVDLDELLHDTAGAAPVDLSARDEPASSTGGKLSQATQLVHIAVERYTFGRTTEGDPFAVPIDGPRIVRPLRGGRHSLRADLAAAFYDLYGKVPSQSALADALQVLEGLAQEEDAVELALRVAQSGDAIIIDLGTPDGAAVVVKPGAWTVESRSPVLFRRTDLTGSMPVPVTGGDIAELLNYVRCTDETWPLLVAWQVAALLPAIPHAILLLGGEQGAGKSTTSKHLVALIDPSPAPLRTGPRNVDDWVVAALGSYVVGLDNVSSLTEWLADALCRSSTGDGLVKRTLYSDKDITVIALRRVVMLNSIDAGALRGDLADRLLVVDLERIAPTDRREDAVIAAAFEAARPRLFGALLDVLAATLAVLPSVHLDTLPRMADFARVVAAVDQVLGTDGLSRYLEEGDRISADVVDGDPVAGAVVLFMGRRTADDWRGTAAELLAILHDYRFGDPLDADRWAAAPKGWPTSPKALAGALRRVAPALRAVNVDVEFGRTGAARWIALRCPSGDAGGDANADPNPPASPPASPPSGVEDAGQDIWGDGSDAGDGNQPSLSVVGTSKEEKGAESGGSSESRGRQPSLASPASSGDLW